MRFSLVSSPYFGTGVQESIAVMGLLPLDLTLAASLATRPKAAVSGTVGFSHAGTAECPKPLPGCQRCQDFMGCEVKMYLERVAEDPHDILGACLPVLPSQLLQRAAAGEGAAGMEDDFWASPNEVGSAANLPCRKGPKGQWHGVCDLWTELEFASQRLCSNCRPRQETLRADANDEAASAERLRRQLEMSEASVKAEAANMTQKTAQEALQLRARGANLEAELARAQKVADQMQQDLAAEAGLVAQLRSQLSMAEALSEDPSAASAISAALGASRRDRDAEEMTPSNWKLVRQLEAERQKVAALQKDLQQAQALNLTLAPASEIRELAGDREAMAERAEEALRAELAATVEELQAVKSSVERREPTADDAEEQFQPPAGGQKRPDTRASFAAAKADDPEGLTSLLASQESLAVALLQPNDEGHSLLQVALEAGSYKAAEKLLEEGQKLFERHEFEQKLREELFEQQRRQFLHGTGRQNALSMLCSREDATREVFALLMEAQADPYQPNAEGVTPFLQCARAGNCAFMMLLLKGTRGAVLLDMDRSCRTALHHAAQAGHKDAVQLLLKAEARVEAIDCSGRMAAALANEAGHDEIFAMIAEEMSDQALEAVFADAAPESHCSETGGREAPEPRETAPPAEEDWDVPLDDPGMMDIPDEEHLQARLHPSGRYDVNRHLNANEVLHGPGHRLQSL
eukprot:s3620_g1.t4